MAIQGKERIMVTYHKGIVFGVSAGNVKIRLQTFTVYWPTFLLGVKNHYTKVGNTCGRIYSQRN